MIIAAELVLTIQLVVLVKGIMILGTAFKEKNLANKIAGFILVIGTAVLFSCTMCHMVKFHKHHKYGFSHYKSKCKYKCQKYTEKLKNCEGDECEKYQRKTERWCEKEKENDDD
jgi:hypothetical protein